MLASYGSIGFVGVLKCANSEEELRGVPEQQSEERHTVFSRSQ